MYKTRYAVNYHICTIYQANKRPSESDLGLAESDVLSTESETPSLQTETQFLKLEAIYCLLCHIL